MLKGKVAIITGGSKGIGEGISLRFAKEGANLALIARNEDDLNKTASACKSFGGDVLVIVADVSETQLCESIITRTYEKFSKIDILVNNAGTAVSSTTEKIDLDEFNKLVRINMYAPFALSKYSIPHLRETKGCILNISSVGSDKPLPTFVSYCMTKSGLDAMTKGLAMELVDDGIRVNSINPGVVNTPLLAKQTEEVQRNLLSHQPLGAVTLEEVAQQAVFLCTSQHTTGSCVIVDGGFITKF